MLLAADGGLLYYLSAGISACEEITGYLLRAARAHVIGLQTGGILRDAIAVEYNLFLAHIMAFLPHLLIFLLNQPVANLDAFLDIIRGLAIKALITALNAILFLLVSLFSTAIAHVTRQCAGMLF